MCQEKEKHYVFSLRCIPNTEYKQRIHSVDASINELLKHMKDRRATVIRVPGPRLQTKYEWY